MIVIDYSLCAPSDFVAKITRAKVGIFQDFDPVRFFLLFFSALKPEFVLFVWKGTKMIYFVCDSGSRVIYEFAGCFLKP